MGKKGVLVRDVLSGSPAEAAGLEGTYVDENENIIWGDLIVGVDGSKIANYSDLYNYSVEVKSASDDASKPKRTTAVRMVSPLPTQSNGQIMVVVPNVRKTIPLFIVMRALGILSDKDIMKDLESNIKNGEQRAINSNRNIRILLAFFHRIFVY